MHRDLLTHPHIGSYSALLLLGFAAGYALARWRTRSQGIEGRHIDNIILLLMVLCPAGARLFSRLFYYPTPLSVWEAFRIWEGGGLVFYGGVIVGIIVVVAYSRFAKLPLLRLGDVMAPSLALGLAFGRVGCFMAGCCWGDVCVTDAQLAAISNPAMKSQVQTVPLLSPDGFALAVQFPQVAGAHEQHSKLGLIASSSAKSLPVHATQLYEAALAFLLCWFLNRRFRKPRRSGDIIALFGIGYGTIRFVLEYLRADSTPSYPGGLTISQVISVLLVAVAAGLWFRNRKLPPGDEVANRSNLTETRTVSEATA